MMTIRSAIPTDEEALGRYGGALMRQHHAADPKRFIDAEDPEAAYGRFLVSQISVSSTAVLVAEDSGRVVGYVYAGIESTNWMKLRGPCGAVHDLFVDEAARGLGAGRALLSAAIAWIQSKGRKQVVLLTKTNNERAQHLFRATGFRPTMIEMTLDLEQHP
jgi:ribosomal protein S18 acetylase RimI-like enzyme